MAAGGQDWIDAMSWRRKGPMAMRQNLKLLHLQTRGEGFTDITITSTQRSAPACLNTGIAVISCLQSSASLTVNENAEPPVLADLTAYLRALVPVEGVKPLSSHGELRAYVHDDEGPDDMPAYIRTVLTCTGLSQSFQGGRLLLGTWQAIYLWEHRRAPMQRRISLHLIGE
jgi:secondary thiamine-phosphate synthase enzyme